MNRYLNIWYKCTAGQAQADFSSRFGAVFLLIGKILRFLFFLIFLILIAGRTKNVAGYSLWEVIFIYATFNLVDPIPQMLLRSVYRFRSYVVSGFFDFYMAQPISPLFRALFGGADILDIPMLIISIVFIIYSSFHLSYFSIAGVMLYILLLLNAFLIALSFHIFVLSIGVATTEVDNTIMLYRDLTQMGRVPVSVYQQAVSFILTFIVPVGIMITFPVQALLGTLSIQFVLYSFAFGIGFLVLSLLSWRFAIRHYSSASS